MLGSGTVTSTTSAREGRDEVGRGQVEVDPGAAAADGDPLEPVDRGIAMTGQARVEPNGVIVSRT